MITHLFRMADDVMDPIVQKSHVQCGACPHDDVCCTSLVTLTRLEAEAIVAYLRAHVPDHVREMIIKALYHQRHYAPRTEVILRRKEHVCWQWFQRRQYCALYDQHTKRCLVYPVRPLMCRGCFATQGTTCQHGDTQATREMEPVMDAALRAAAEGVSGLPHQNIDKVLGELSRMVLHAYTQGPYAFNS